MPSAATSPARIKVRPARSWAWPRRARPSTLRTRAVRPGCFDLGRLVGVRLRVELFFTGGRRLAGVRVWVATMATTVTAATPAPQRPVLRTDRGLPDPYPSAERQGGRLSDLHD